MTAHGRCCLMILLRIKFVSQVGQDVGQQGWRNDSIDQFAAGPSQQRPISDGKKSKKKIGKAAVMDDRLRSQTDDGVVAMPPGEFMEKMAGLFWRDRQLDGDQQFLRRKRRLVDASEEVLRGYPSLA